MRTRMPPNSRVRHVALPVVPAYSTGSIFDHSVTPNGMPVIFMGGCSVWKVSDFTAPAVVPRGAARRDLTTAGRRNNLRCIPALQVEFRVARLFSHLRSVRDSTQAKCAVARGARGYARRDG